MKQLNSSELRKLYLDYYKSKGHAVIGSASLIPENDPTVLFTTAGMHPSCRTFWAKSTLRAIV